jgi:hypothetical protein
MTALQNAMRALSSALQGGVLRSKIISHALTKGELREEDVAAALEPHIPGRMATANGVVVNAQGEQSAQQDLLIIDSNVSPPFATAGRLGLHPIESVLAAIEIKSGLTSVKVAVAVRNGVSLKRLLQPVRQPMIRVTRAGAVLYEPAPVGTPGDVFWKPFTAILGLRGDARPETLCESFVDANLELDPGDRTNAFLVLDAFVAGWSSRSDGAVLQIYPEDAKALARFDLGKDSLLYFYAFLFDAIQTYEPPPLNLRGYVEASLLESDNLGQIIPVRGE